MTSLAEPQIDLNAESANPLRLDYQLCFALYTAGNLVTRLYRPLLQPLGITYLQYLALLVLWEQAPQSVGELGRRLGLDSGTLTPLFKRLEAAGLVDRKRDEADERRVMIHLTPKGIALRQKAVNIPGAVFRQLPLPIDQLIGLKAHLDGLVKGLGVADEA